MRRRGFQTIDVFSDQPLMGNPLAVVLESEELSSSTMQQFSRWTNLSEATFLSKPKHPDADYAVRIFDPSRELPFAGHPTLGSCHAWLQAGGRPKGTCIVQECGIGLVRIRQDNGRLAFAAPPRLKSGPLPESEVELIARGFGVARSDIIAHSWCNNGPNWRGVLLKSADQVLAIQAQGDLLAGLDVGIIGPRDNDAETQFEVRAFFQSKNGLVEDPVTGSLNAALAQWLIADRLAPQSYVAAQGTLLGRRGRVSLQQEGHDIWVGGHCVTVLDGVALL